MGILIGIAISEGAIKSVEDTAETYVPEFGGTEYGKTPIRDLLHMSSGVYFGEESDNEHVRQEVSVIVRRYFAPPAFAPISWSARSSSARTKAE